MPQMQGHLGHWVHHSLESGAPQAGGGWADGSDVQRGGSVDEFKNYLSERGGALMH